METSLEVEKIREKAWQLCREFLQGAWKKVRREDLSISHISGGLSNLVFSVALPSNVQVQGREPHVTLLRLFGEEHTTPELHYKLIIQTVVFTMLAERNLGPKLHGVFPGGRFEEFIVGHTLTPQEMRTVDYSRQIARNVALVHSLNVPVSKDPSWLGDTMRSYVKNVAPIRLESVSPEERSAAAYVSGMDLRGEVDWVLTFLNEVHSPVVFSHNDINTGNILVREDGQDWDPVVFIDYEFSAYNHRAFDLANHFCEWMYDYGRKDFPFYYRQREKYPSVSEQKQWVRHYLDTYQEQQQLEEENNQGGISSISNISNGVDRKNNVNNIVYSEAHLLEEVKAFTVACHLLWALWSVRQACSATIPFAYYKYAADRLEDYHAHKELLMRGEVPAKRRKGTSESCFDGRSGDSYAGRRKIASESCLVRRKAGSETSNSEED